jgi:hypothetical protein
MTTVIDGFSLLIAVGQHRELFFSLAVEARKAALAMSKKFLKGKGIGLVELKSFHGAVGAETFALILEDLKEAELRALIKKIDKYYPNLLGDKAVELRSHLKALSSSRADLSPKPARPQRASRKSSRETNTNVKKGSTAGMDWPKSMSARPSRHS